MASVRSVAVPAARAVASGVTRIESTAETDLVMTVAIASDGDSFELATVAGGFNAVVNWGDGNSDLITASNDADLTHTYATAGTYTIAISGTFPRLRMGGSSTRSALRTVENLGVVGWTDEGLRSAFQNCDQLTTFSAGNTDTSSVEVFQGMFQNCSSLTSVDARGMDTSSATNMSIMFKQTSALSTVDVSQFNTSSVTNFAQMFRTTGATDVRCDLFDISAATNLQNFFGNGSLTTARYDAVLIAWAAQTVNSGLTVNFGNSKFTAGGTAEAARTSLINDDGWTISDGGAA